MSKDSNENPKIKKGYSVAIATLFVAGENVGCALLRLPFAMNETGWLGLVLIILSGINAGIAGVLIGKCWMIVENNHPHLREKCRYPYSAIGEIAFGRKMKIVVAFCLHITLIGSAVVALLICAELLKDALESYVSISYGLWIIIIAISLLPILMLGTPSEFWPAAGLALLTSALAIILILIDAVNVLIVNKKIADSDQVTANSLFLAFGSIFFAYGGTAAFPSYQNDMRKRKKFPLAVIIGFVILLILYTPISSIGYIAYGKHALENIILNMPYGANRMTALVLISGHLFFAFLLLINGSIQEIEESLNISKDFSYQRFVLRSAMLLFVILIGETIPSFGKIMNLVGGSSIAMLTYILPPLFYLKLRTPQENDKGLIWLIKKYFFYQIMIVGIFGGFMCTIESLIAIASPSAFSMPCYIDPKCHG